MNKFTPFFININSVEVVAYSLGVPVVTMELNVSAARTNWDVYIGVYLFRNEFSDSSVTSHTLPAFTCFIVSQIPEFKRFLSIPVITFLL